MTTQIPQYIQTISVADQTNPIENTDPTNLASYLPLVGITPNTSDASEPDGSSASFNIVEVEGILVNELRIKPQPIIVVPRLLSHTTTIQMDLIEVTADGQPNVITREPQDEDEYSPRLIYCSYYTCCSCCCSCCRCYTCHVSKECALCLASITCIVAMVFSGIH